MDKKKLMEATWPIHQKVERMAFPKKMFKGELDKETYHRFLHNEYCCIHELEKIANNKNLFKGLEDVPFSERILSDISEIGDPSWDHRRLSSTKEYISFHFRDLVLEQGFPRRIKNEEQSNHSDCRCSNPVLCFW